MFLAPIAGDLLGDYPPVYAQWAAQVKAHGGIVTAKNGRAVAKYPDPAVWVPKVNARQLPVPDEYSGDGRTAYIYAPRSVQDAAKQLGQATATEAAAAGKQLEQTWWDAIFSAPRNAISQLLGIPGWLVTLGAVVGGAYLVKQFLPGRLLRANPRGRRRRRSRR